MTLFFVEEKRDAVTAVYSYKPVWVRMLSF